MMHTSIVLLAMSVFVLVDFVLVCVAIWCSG